MMLKNLNITNGLVFSQEIMLELTKTGMSREKAYRLVQNHAKRSMEKNIDLIELIKKDKNITNKLSINKIKNIFTLKKHFKNINFIFKRVFR